MRRFLIILLVAAGFSLRPGGLPAGSLLDDPPIADTQPSLQTRLSHLELEQQRQREDFEMEQDRRRLQEFKERQHQEHPEFYQPHQNDPNRFLLNPPSR